MTSIHKISQLNCISLDFNPPILPNWDSDHIRLASVPDGFGWTHCNQRYEEMKWNHPIISHLIILYSVFIKMLYSLNHNFTTKPFRTVVKPPQASSSSGCCTETDPSKPKPTPGDPKVHTSSFPPPISRSAESLDPISWGMDRSATNWHQKNHLRFLGTPF